MVVNNLTVARPTMVYCTHSFADRSLNEYAAICRKGMAGLVLFSEVSAE